jgi:hypothetical protein
MEMERNRGPDRLEKAQRAVLGHSSAQRDGEAWLIASCCWLCFARVHSGIRLYSTRWTGSHGDGEKVALSHPSGFCAERIAPLTFSATTPSLRPSPSQQVPRNYVNTVYIPLRSEASLRKSLTCGERSLLPNEISNYDKPDCRESKESRRGVSLTLAPLTFSATTPSLRPSPSQQVPRNYVNTVYILDVRRAILASERNFQLRQARLSRVKRVKTRCVRANAHPV